MLKPAVIIGAMRITGREELALWRFWGRGAARRGGSVAPNDDDDDNDAEELANECVRNRVLDGERVLLRRP